MDEYSAALLHEVDACVAGWITRSVESRLSAAGIVADDRLRAAADDAGRAARGQVHEELAHLLALDVDEQRTNPLAVLRRAVVHATAVLDAAGAPAVDRDEFERRAVPDDRYGLSPATWRDVDERLVEPGLVWGAWKAKTVLDRRRAEGRR